MSYKSFLATKAIVSRTAGCDVAESDLNPNLFPFQRKLVQWALRKGRCALFCDTGLGKTIQQLAWAEHAAERTLILAPLAVAHQTVREGQRFGIPVTYARTQADAAPVGITVTNYEMLRNFDTSQFGAVVLDESSILKNFDGKTRSQLIESFADTPMRLACTATPAPNDIVEIGNHAEFLGVMTHVEMRAAFFTHEHDKGNDYKLKTHARDAFYRWMASWGMSIRKPSDLGFPDDGYDLPGLTIRSSVVETNHRPEGMLFATTLNGIGERAKVRKATLADRVARAVAIIEAEPDEPWLIWCGLNDEATALAAAMPGSVNVEGSMSADAKADALAAFSDGRTRRLITKPSIAGMGMNWQHCARMVFVGLSDSYEDYYQCIRRCFRFGQSREVVAHIVLSDLERAIYENVMRKEREADRTAAELVKHLAQFERAEIAGIGKAALVYEPQRQAELPSWLKGA